ncbi:MAG: FAD-dependent oxidoreductase [Clostridia bacterium]
MKSIWVENVEIERRDALEQNLKTEVAVIGAGMAGILTAYLLRQNGVNCVVLEADCIGSGQTKGTTAKITSQHGLCYAALVQRFGIDLARQYGAANEQAIAQYRAIITDQGIDCDFAQKRAYVYATEDVEKLKCETKVAAALGLPATFSPRINLPFSTVGAVCFDQQAQFHPMKFLKAVSQDLRIYEKSPVQLVEAHTLHVGGHTVTAQKVVFTTHFPFVNSPGFYFARMYQSRAYSIALQNAALLDGIYVDANEDGLSFRNAENLLILCGMDHRTGENSEGGRYKALQVTARALYPNSFEVAHWSAQDCMTADLVPYIGNYCASTPDWFVATGFNKWGMSTSMVAAQILTDRILGRDNAYAQVFSPQRFNIATAVEVAKGGGQAIKGLSRQNLTIPQTTLDELPAEHGGVVDSGNDKVGVYLDENRQAYLVNTRCPHLGCQVEWNPDEKSWDCPCHGSRFDIHGQLIDNPAQRDLLEKAQT